MKINWIDHARKGDYNKHTLLGYLILKVIANNEILDNQLKQCNLHGIDMTVTINNIEVNTEEVFAGIEAQMNKLIAENAEELLSKTLDVRSDLLALEQNLIDILHTAEIKADKILL